MHAPERPVFDRDYALGRHGSEATLRLLAPMALKAIARTRAALEQPGATPQQHITALHRLRGNALEIGLMALAESTRPLELAWRGLGPADAIPHLHAACLACMHEAEQALQALLGGTPG